MNPRPSIASLVASSFRTLWRAPFRVFFVLALLISVVSDTASEDWGGIALLVVSLYLQIATTLAAGAEDPSPSADRWVKAAFKRRCFWRYLLTGLSVFFIVGAPAILLASFLGTVSRAGAIAAAVGGFAGAAMLSGMFALAQPTSAIERVFPGAAIRRSIELSEPARVGVATIFVSLILVPAGLLQLGYALGWAEDLGPYWLIVSSVGVVVGMWGTIAMTRIYVALGGRSTPALDEIGPLPTHA